MKPLSETHPILYRQVFKQYDFDEEDIYYLTEDVQNSCVDIAEHKREVFRVGNEEYFRGANIGGEAVLRRVKEATKEFENFLLAEAGQSDWSVESMKKHFKIFRQAAGLDEEVRE